MPPHVPLISVLLPVYNAEETLEGAARSLLRQTFQSFEVIAVDDGSCDASPAILRRLRDEDARIRPVFRPHEGLIAALNTGLRYVRGDWIARMDADDCSHPQRFQRQYQVLTEHPEVSVVGCLVRSFPRSQVREGFRVYEEWLNGLMTHEDMVRELFIESPLPHPSVLMRRKDLEELGGYQDRGWPEDYDLWLRFYIGGKRFAKVPEILYFWRERPARLSRTDPRYSVENFLRAKAHYLIRGPLRSRTSLIWGAGKTGRRLSKHLLREGARIAAFIDIDPEKIGRSLRGIGIHAPSELRSCWNETEHPLLLSAVASREARRLIRAHLRDMGLEEGRDFLCVA